MSLNRRNILTAGAGLSAGLGALAASTAVGARENASPRKQSLQPLVLEADQNGHHTKSLQAAIDQAAKTGTAVLLPAGVFRVGTLTLHENTKLIGASGTTTLQFTGGDAFITGREANSVVLEGFTIDGALLAPAATDFPALLDLQNCADITLARLTIRQSLVNGMALTGCSGRVSDCIIHNALLTGIFSLDATGLTIAHNTIRDCGNNGIQVWRSKAGEDGTLVTSNRVQRIASKGGGTGQNGNGVNVFRAGSVVVSNNRITDCTYSAIRGNAASNFQIIGNSCARLGEVALYAEFGFEGAVITNNVVDKAATGIAVTNFYEGGRLATVQGNLIRNLVRREYEPQDKRGEGIAIEADSIVSGNVIESAPTCGIMVGWGRYMRNCLVTQNLVREVGAGILITSDTDAGACLITNNMIAGTKNGAIRAMDRGQPLGPDLAIENTVSSRISISGNMIA
jgi:uncharacterized secreted repeat protein (TIGR03808 family)